MTWLQVPKMGTRLLDVTGTPAFNEVALNGNRTNDSTVKAASGWLDRLLRELARRTSVQPSPTRWTAFRLLLRPKHFFRAGLLSVTYHPPWMILQPTQTKILPGWKVFWHSFPVCIACAWSGLRLNGTTCKRLHSHPKVCNADSRPSASAI